MSWKEKSALLCPEKPVSRKPMNSLLCICEFLCVNNTIKYNFMYCVLKEQHSACNESINKMSEQVNQEHPRHTGKCHLAPWFSVAVLQKPLLPIQGECVLGVVSMNGNYPNVLLKVHQSAHSTVTLWKKESKPARLWAGVKCTLFEDDCKCCWKKIQWGSGRVSEFLV